MPKKGRYAVTTRTYIYINSHVNNIKVHNNFENNFLILGATYIIYEVINRKTLLYKHVIIFYLYRLVWSSQLHQNSFGRWNVICTVTGNSLSDSHSKSLKG